MYVMVEGMVDDDVLDPYRLPLGAPPDSLLQYVPNSAFLPVAGHARIPEANVKVFLCQVEDWVWQFGLMAVFDEDRDGLAAAIGEVQTATKRLLNSFENLGRRSSGPPALNNQFELRLHLD